MKRLALSDNIDTDEVEIINRKEIIEPTGSLPIRNSGNFKGLGWCLFISPFCEYKIEYYREPYSQE